MSKRTFYIYISSYTCIWLKSTKIIIYYAYKNINFQLYVRAFVATPLTPILESTYEIRTRTYEEIITFGINFSKKNIYMI